MSKSVRHIFLVLIACFAAAGCEGISAKDPATRSEQEKASDLFLRCLISQAPKYDDPTLPVDDVARVLMTGPCHATSDAVVETYERDSSLYVQKGFRRDFEQGMRLGMARGVVIAVRQLRTGEAKI
jgi:hypothetical protein|nr:hypothetical protein [uncultured Dongia sp.]